MTSLSIDNALKTVADKFSFSVDKFPLYGPDNMATPHFGLFKSDSGECVGKSVSARYVPHTTSGRGYWTFERLYSGGEVV